MAKFELVHREYHNGHDIEIHKSVNGTFHYSATNRRTGMAFPSHSSYTSEQSALRAAKADINKGGNYE